MCGAAVGLGSVRSAESDVLVFLFRRLLQRCPVCLCVYMCMTVHESLCLCWCAEYLLIYIFSHRYLAVTVDTKQPHISVSFFQNFPSKLGHSLYTLEFKI